MYNISRRHLVQLSLLLCIGLGVVAAGYFFLTRNPDFANRLLSRREPVFSPYLDVNVAIHSITPNELIFIEGDSRSIIGAPKIPLPEKLKSLTLAFATGECGNEHWGGLSATEMAQANLPALQKANIGYIISTGGVDGVFSCTTEEGMKKFVALYDTGHLIGFDFNIEVDQPEPLIENLVEQVRLAMQRHPKLRFSFTLPSLASTRQGRSSLNPHGEMVMRVIQRAGLKNYFVNLMVMNFGGPQSGNCVVRGDQCDMGASAIQAVKNFSKQYDLPLNRIEVTPMIGMNDVKQNVFTMADAQKLSSFVRSSNLAGLHFWSLNRDGPCDKQFPGVSSGCSGLEGPRRLDFTQTFGLDLY